ncbi:MAG: hypothetical protein K6E15_05030, partial [Prevotella sp.]|nr:hypothetical protein [Prevotella sp.]
MKRLVLAMIVMLAFAVNADAQGFLGRLKDRAVSTAKNAIESNVQQKVYSETNKAVDDTFDGKVIKKKGKKSKDDEAVNEEAEETETEDEPQTATSSDFKRGSVVLFQDDVTAETVGEFPSKWDLLDGNAEVKSHGGVKAIEVTNNGVITPLIKEPGAYLPEEFTIEYDFYYWTGGKDDIG